MLCNQQVKQLCCHFFCSLVDKREQRPHSQSEPTNHGVKTSTSPYRLYFSEDGSARKPARIAKTTRLCFSRLHLAHFCAFGLRIILAKQTAKTGTSLYLNFINVRKHSINYQLSFFNIWIL